MKTCRCLRCIVSNVPYIVYYEDPVDDSNRNVISIMEQMCNKYRLVECHKVSWLESLTEDIIDFPRTSSHVLSFRDKTPTSMVSVFNFQDLETLFQTVYNDCVINFFVFFNRILQLKDLIDCNFKHTLYNIENSSYNIFQHFEISTNHDIQEYDEKPSTNVLDRMKNVQSNIKRRNLVQNHVKNFDIDDFVWDISFDQLNAQNVKKSPDISYKHLSEPTFSNHGQNYFSPGDKGNIFIFPPKSPKILQYPEIPAKNLESLPENSQFFNEKNIICSRGKNMKKYSEMFKASTPPETYLNTVKSDEIFMDINKKLECVEPSSSPKFTSSTITQNESLPKYTSRFLPISTKMSSYQKIPFYSRGKQISMSNSPTKINIPNKQFDKEGLDPIESKLKKVSKFKKFLEHNKSIQAAKSERKKSESINIENKILKLRSKSLKRDLSTSKKRK